MSQIKVNSLYAWFLAARPKTLTGAVTPVLIGTALALLHNSFVWIPALVCFLFAGLMQIAANFINDLFDYLKGSDREDRLGPKRTCAQGWITPRAMMQGIAVCVTLACLIGSVLILYGGWNMILIGAASVIFAFLYTTGPYPLSYYGWGDVMVIVFFGFAAVGGTYYVQALQWTMDTTILSLSCGLVIETLLVINNYRDRDADSKSGKLTLIVRFGEPFGRYLYLYSGLLAVLLLLILLFEGHYLTALLPLVYLIPHFIVWREMVKIHSGKKLNSILGKTSRNMLLFGVLVVVGMVLDHLLSYMR
jgi:1,4-dihydroxy-2-naphthoate octaprenyltransferase